MACSVCTVDRAFLFSNQNVNAVQRDFFSVYHIALEIVKDNLWIIVFLSWYPKSGGQRICLFILQIN